MGPSIPRKPRHQASDWRGSARRASEFALRLDVKTDVSLKTFLGRGSGESLQMMFNGDGFVVIQPYEEIAIIQQTQG